MDLWIKLFYHHFSIISLKYFQNIHLCVFLSNFEKKICQDILLSLWHILIWDCKIINLISHFSVHSESEKLWAISIVYSKKWKEDLLRGFYWTCQQKLLDIIWENIFFLHKSIINTLTSRSVKVPNGFIDIYKTPS